MNKSHTLLVGIYPKMSGWDGCGHILPQKITRDDDDDVAIERQCSDFFASQVQGPLISTLDFYGRAPTETGVVETIESERLLGTTRPPRRTIKFTVQRFIQLRPKLGQWESRGCTLIHVLRHRLLLRKTPRNVTLLQFSAN